MKKHGIILIVLFVFFFCLKSNGQDPSLSQSYSNLMQTNPALTGAVICDVGVFGGQFGLNYNHENVSNNGRYGNFTASLHQYMDKLLGGIGVQYSRNSSGDNSLVRNTVAVDYSHILPLSKTATLRIGVEGAFLNQGLDYSKVRYGVNILDVYPVNFDNYSTEKKSFMNYSSGVFLNSRRFYLGFAVHNLFEPNQSFENDPNGPLKRRYTFQSGLRFNYPRKMRRTNGYVLPNILWIKQNDYQQIKAGIYASKKRLNVGVMYKKEENGSIERNSITTLIGLDYNRVFIGYSYDANLESNSLNVRGVHELTLRVEWCMNSHLSRKSWRKNQIPTPIF